MKGKKKLEPRLLGITKDGILRLDENTKETIHMWPLEEVKNWHATQNIFIIDFGDSSQGYYTVQTPDGDKISEIVSDYIGLMKKEKERLQSLNDDLSCRPDIMDDDILNEEKGALTLEHEDIQVCHF